MNVTARSRRVATKRFFLRILRVQYLKNNSIHCNQNLNEIQDLAKEQHIN